MLITLVAPPFGLISSFSRLPQRGKELSSEFMVQNLAKHVKTESKQAEASFVCYTHQSCKDNFALQSSTFRREVTFKESFQPSCPKEHLGGLVWV